MVSKSGQLSGQLMVKGVGWCRCGGGLPSVECFRGGFSVSDEVEARCLRSVRGGGECSSRWWVFEVRSVFELYAVFEQQRYNLIFVPFTGVDHNKQCVTFGVGLLFNETIESYKWLLQGFLKAHNSQPSLVLTNQDLAMRLSEKLQNTELTACIHRLVWNVYIKPSTFESRWQELLVTFGLEDHEWLSEMYEIRERWVLTYFRDIPMCCLMKTTSRCESSNVAFKVNSTNANTLVQFMHCYEARIDSQRYRQRLSEYKTSSTMFRAATDLTIEKHAFMLYSHAVFMEVRKEITKGMLCCYVSNTKQEDGLTVFYVTHLDRRCDLTYIYQVKFNGSDNTTVCSCMGFIRIGYLCRHAFCVYRMKNVESIPDHYIMDRWRRDVLPKKIFSIVGRYGVDTNPESILRNEVLELVSECVDVVRTDTESLDTLVEN
ncbi:hypothetical protein M8C21_012513 [Ambrosia artemisiifolia]|uniref:SWIM-type domain-containing protein n=1 Tax=Ambrosia artemisiifolia TaxID=4212 RepID=A0AAD5CNS5_AMBAR|nr:hypothetical protein M8C21_012513 [Ambrosia artemisiifolia]